MLPRGGSLSVRFIGVEIPGWTDLTVYMAIFGCVRVCVRTLCRSCLVYTEENLRSGKLVLALGGNLHIFVRILRLSRYPWQNIVLKSVHLLGLQWLLRTRLVLGT